MTLAGLKPQSLGLLAYFLGLLYAWSVSNHLWQAALWEAMTSKTKVSSQIDKGLELFASKKLSP